MTIHLQVRPLVLRLNNEANGSYTLIGALPSPTLPPRLDALGNHDARRKGCAVIMLYQRP